MLDAYLYEGKRTPFGRHAGALAKVRPDDLLGGVIKQVVAESKFKPEQIEDVIVGCANQGGEDSRWRYWVHGRDTRRVSCYNTVA